MNGHSPFEIMLSISSVDNIANECKLITIRWCRLGTDQVMCMYGIATDLVCTDGKNIAVAIKCSAVNGTDGSASEEMKAGIAYIHCCSLKKGDVPTSARKVFRAHYNI